MVAEVVSRVALEALEDPDVTRKAHPVLDLDEDIMICMLSSVKLGMEGN